MDLILILNGGIYMNQWINLDQLASYQNLKKQTPVLLTEPWPVKTAQKGFKRIKYPWQPD